MKLENQRVVCIDFGGAYTKVAIRDGWNGRADLSYDLSLAADEDRFCVPSVVAVVRRRGELSWLIGHDAAMMLPGDGVKVIRYWKAALFPSWRDAVTWNDADVSLEQVAVRFFAELRAEIERKHRLSVRHAPVRVCVPAFTDAPVPPVAIEDILREAGFTPAPERPVVYEPEANVWGILTRGANHTWFPPCADFQKKSGLSPALGRMIDVQGMFRALARMKGRYNVLVTDIGAYTTDFGYVSFDATWSTDETNCPLVKQLSQPLGIRDLDDMVLDALDSRSRGALQRLPAEEFDRQKARIYAGREVALAGTLGGLVTVGRSAHQSVIRDAMKSFARKIAAARRNFLDTLDAERVHLQCVTGGGSLIRLLAEAVFRAQIDGRTPDYIDLLDPEEPQRSFTRERDTPERIHRNEELTRGASAIGGSSVFFG